MEVSRACYRLLSVCLLLYHGGSHSCSSSFLFEKENVSFLSYCGLKENRRKSGTMATCLPKIPDTLRLVTASVALGLLEVKGLTLVRRRRPSSHAQGNGPRLVCRTSICSHLRATMGFSATGVHRPLSRVVVF